jgi:hypothetical protein
MRGIIAAALVLFSSAAVAAPVNLSCTSGRAVYHVTVNEDRGTISYVLLGIDGPTFTEQAAFSADKISTTDISIDRATLAFTAYGGHGKCTILKRAI